MIIIKEVIKGGASMRIQYHQLPPEVRDLTRAIESKGHSPYIRALLLKRVPFKKINIELSRLSLAGVDESFYKTYFKYNLLPILQKKGLAKYYTEYLVGIDEGPLDFKGTFGQNEDARISFCTIAEITDTSIFFSEDIKQHFNNKIPLDANGNPIITLNDGAQMLDVLLHEKRHMIEGWIVEGYSPKLISQSLEEKYDLLLPEETISLYAKTFMNTKRKSMEDAVEELQSEKLAFEEQIESIRKDTSTSIGEKTMVISTLKEKISILDNRIKSAQVAHNANAFGTGVLDYNDFRYMITDMAQRAHRRFIQIDSKTEHNVVPRLVQLSGIVFKSVDKIVMLDKAMRDTHDKTINEEMLEVITPTLDRLEQEELEARQKYMSQYAPDVFLEQAGSETEELEILGVDD